MTDANPQQDTQAQKGKGLDKIKWLLVLIFCGYIGLNFSMVVLSRKVNPDLVSRDYYDRSKNVDQVLRQEEESQRLGWRTRLVPGGEGGDDVAVFITDSQGEPLRGLAGSISAYRPSDSGMDQTLPLTESGSQPGLYQARFERTATGPWDLTVNVSRGAETFSRTMRYLAR
ncbi:MAG: FixH family protein [Deltaproteobacteria bacterium]|nr:FixH family protein [Deltaproteobacteria bacterium]